MSQTTPDPVAGRDDPFRSDDDQRDENLPDDSIGIGIPLVGDALVDDADRRTDRDEPGDRV